MHQAQQPFKGKDPPDRQWTGFADTKKRLLGIAREGDCQVGEQQTQKADTALDDFGQRGGGDAGATEELETTDTHRGRKEPEAFIIKLMVDQIVE